jgi:ribosomal protein L29
MKLKSSFIEVPRLSDGDFLKPANSKSRKCFPERFQNPENQSGPTNRVSAMRKEIAILAGPRGWDDTRESWLNRVCTAVPTVSYRTVKALWYGEIQDPEHWAIRDIRRAVAVIEAQQHANALAGQLASLLSGCDPANPAHDRASTAALVSALRALRGQDSAGNSQSMTHIHKADPNK